MSMCVVVAGGREADGGRRRAGGGGRSDADVWVGVCLSVCLSASMQLLATARVAVRPGATSMMDGRERWWVLEEVLATAQVPFVFKEAGRTEKALGALLSSASLLMRRAHWSAGARHLDVVAQTVGSAACKRWDEEHPTTCWLQQRRKHTTPKTHLRGAHDIIRGAQEKRAEETTTCCLSRTASRP